jgi:hypothetical protein
VQDNSHSGDESSNPSIVKCPSCGHENLESAVRCSDCRVPLHTNLDDRTMDSPAKPTNRETTQPSRAESSAQTSAMVRTPSGHSPSQSRSSSGYSAKSRILESGDELGPRFQIDALLGEGAWAASRRRRTATWAAKLRLRCSFLN